MEEIRIAIEIVSNRSSRETAVEVFLVRRNSRSQPPMLQRSLRTKASIRDDDTKQGNYQVYHVPGPEIFVFRVEVAIVCPCAIVS